MFEVHVISPLDESWESRDKKLYRKAGRQSDSAGTVTARKVNRREHVWMVGSFEEARKMKRKLEQVDGVNVTIREE